MEHAGGREVDAGWDFEGFCGIKDARGFVKLVGGQAAAVIHNYRVFKIDAPAGGKGDIGVEPGGFSSHVEIFKGIKEAVVFFVVFALAGTAGKLETLGLAKQADDDIQVVNVQVKGQLGVILN